MRKKSMGNFYRKIWVFITSFFYFVLIVVIFIELYGGIHIFLKQLALADLVHKLEIMFFEGKHIQIPPKIYKCFTNATIEQLPSKAKLVDTFYIPYNEEREWLFGNFYIIPYFFSSFDDIKIIKVKIYRSGNDYYAVFLNRSYKAGNPQSCREYFSSIFY